MPNNGLVVRFFADTRSAVADIGKLERALGRSATAGEKWQKVGNRMVGAMGVAAAAAGALALKVGVDSAKAWMEEEKSLAQINTALKNLGYEAATDEVALFIDNLQYSANVADTELRPALSRLARSTGDLGEAQRALGIALDISAATGKDLDTVANALGKAYDGNAASLGRLGLGLDKATLKGGNMAVITQELIDKFGGARAAQTGTLSGAISGVQIAWDELQESFGKGLLTGGGDTVKEIEDAEQRLRNLQPSAERAGSSLQNLAVGALEVYDNFVAMGGALAHKDFELIGQMFTANDKELRNLNRIAMSVGAEFTYTQYAAYGATKSMTYFKSAAEETTKATDDQVASIKRLQGALSGMSKQQSIMEQRFSLNQLLREGPDKSGRRKGAGGKMTEFTTGADRKEFAFSVASQSRSLADSLLGEGKRGGARNALAEARRTIRGLGLSDQFEGDLLATLRTPSSLRPGGKPRAGTPESGAQVSMINYNFAGDLIVRDAADAAEQAKRIARLKALGSGRVAEAARYAGMAAGR